MKMDVETIFLSALTTVVLQLLVSELWSAWKKTS